MTLRPVLGVALVMLKSLNVLGVVLTGHMWSTPHQFRAVRSENSQSHDSRAAVGRRGRPRTCHGQVTHNGAHAHACAANRFLISCVFVRLFDVLSSYSLQPTALRFTPRQPP